MSRETITACVFAGVPAVNRSLYHRIRFLVGDPAALIEWRHADGATESLLIIRDIEMERARRSARADRVACPADYTPATGLSGDRETATAQALAEKAHALIQSAALRWNEVRLAEKFEACFGTRATTGSERDL